MNKLTGQMAGIREGEYSSAPRLIRIAANNSSGEDKQIADFVCSGSHDELIINRAVESLIHGGTIQLLDGDYCIDSFPNEGNSAIFFGFNNGNARVINFVGSTENKSYNTRFGVTIHVSKEAIEAMDDSGIYRVFYGCAAKPEAPGAFFTYTHVNNVNFDNFYLYFYDASKPVRGLDCSNFGAVEIRQVGIYTEKYFHDRFMHVRPATPCAGSIGVYSVPSSNDEMARIGYDTVNVGGLYTGFFCNGVDHLIMKTCSAARCCYGYIFRSGAKTLTMLNCCDEGNTHLPKFIGTGHLSCIDFNIERFNADYIPFDPAGDSEAQAIEETSGGWHGFISYTLQGAAFDLRRFWKKGHGVNFQTVNLDHNRTTRPEYPEYLETCFDPASNKTLTWNEQAWVDAMGNIVP